MSRRTAALAIAVVAVGVAVALVAIGRRESSRQVARQNAGIRRVADLIGALDSRDLSGFRVLPAFDCLTYRRGPNVFALELCVDPAGRVVEAIDRRRAEHRRFYNLTFDPDAATVRVARAEVSRLLVRMGVRASAAGG